MNFNDLKTNSGNLSQLIDELNKQNPKPLVDERFWKPSWDKKRGVGTALIRFLPATKSLNVPFVHVKEYFFKGPGGVYAEKCLLTIGQSDPVTTLNKEMWDTNIEANREIVSGRKINKRYISNIYVLSDPDVPENEGKVFLFKYGPQIFEKIQTKIRPEFKHETAFDPTDFWTGANFRIKIKMSANNILNYADSFFESQSPLLGGDDKKLESVYLQQYDLYEFIDPSNFKSYEELEKRFKKVIGSHISTKQNTSSVVKENNNDVPSVKETQNEHLVDSDDDDLEFFKQFQTP